MAEDAIKNRFLEAYDLYADAIYRHCFFRVYSRGRAEELTQETFMRVWQYINSPSTGRGPSGGKEIRNMRAFLYQIATNLIIDDSRKKKARKAQWASGQYGEASLDAIMENPLFPEPSSEDHTSIEQMVLTKEVLAAIENLPEDYREVLIMRYVDDLTPKEIGEILGISANNVSVKINRALKALKALIG